MLQCYYTCSPFHRCELCSSEKIGFVSDYPHSRALRATTGCFRSVSPSDPRNCLSKWDIFWDILYILHHISYHVIYDIWHDISKTDSHHMIMIWEVHMIWKMDPVHFKMEWSPFPLHCYVYDDVSQYLCSIFLGFVWKDFLSPSSKINLTSSAPLDIYCIPPRRISTHRISKSQMTFFPRYVNIFLNPNSIICWYG